MGRPHIFTLRSGNLRHQETLYHHSWCCVHFVTVSIPVETKKSEGLTINAHRIFTAAMIICDLVDAGIQLEYVTKISFVLTSET